MAEKWVKERGRKIEAVKEVIKKRGLRVRVEEERRGRRSKGRREGGREGGMEEKEKKGGGVGGKR